MIVGKMYILCFVARNAKYKFAMYLQNVEDPFLSEQYSHHTASLTKLAISQIISPPNIIDSTQKIKIEHITNTQFSVNALWIIARRKRSCWEGNECLLMVILVWTIISSSFTIATFPGTYDSGYSYLYILAKLLPFSRSICCLLVSI